MGKKLRKTKQGLALLLSFAMIGGTLAAGIKSASADEAVLSYEKKGEYQYSSVFEDYVPKSDSYYYTDECFMRSSYIGCDHLSILSAQLAAASGSYYGEGGSAQSYDTSVMSQNITNMLTDIGFENVEANAYYSEEKLPDSCGVAVGTRKITQDGKEYTLIAVVPRSSGYRMEWEGDFLSGSGVMHSGFKSARDEVLRYVKNYINNNGISGDLKFWFAGLSRGGAVAGLTAGFLADGGAAYFGDSVSVTPENIYCYTYAAPNSITDGASKATVLSVEGARGGVYAADSPGSAYTSTASGTVSIHGENFNGIRNFTSENDLVAKVLPAAWGFDKYGQALSVDADGKVSAEEMLGQLTDASPTVAGIFNKSGDYRDFSYYIVNLDELKLVKDTKTSAGTMADFEQKRIDALTALITSKDSYVSNGYQDILSTIGALAGLLGDTTDVKDVKLNQAAVIEPLAYSVLAFSCERYIADGKAKTEEEAIPYVLADGLEFLTGKKVSVDTYTFDELLAEASAYLFEHKDTALGQKAFTSIEGVIPVDYQPFIPMLFGGFSKKYAEGGTPTLRESLVSYLYACAYGPEEGCEFYGDPSFSDAKSCRAVIYAVLPMFVTGVDSETLEEAIGTGGNGSMDGSAPISKSSVIIYPLLLTVKDRDKNDVTLDSISEVADFSCTQLLDTVAPSVINKVTQQFDRETGERVRAKLIGIKQNITSARRVLCYALFYNPGEEYNITSSVRTATTLIGNINIIPVAHTQETYVAWARALAASDYGLGIHEIEIPDLDKKTSDGGKSRRDSASETGDENQMIYILMMLSSAGVFGTALYLKKRDTLNF